jgi:hypothetical protein
VVNKYKPKIPRIISPTVPHTKISEGIPSKMRLIILPKANPNINKILDIMATFQYLTLKIPSIHKEAKTRYCAIIALKTLAPSIVVRFISKHKLGLKPYTNATGTTIITEITRERFLKLL